ncbi:hypothetical protein IJS77_04310 [bacterium]|nr:hypothetical protein [bacterium]
MDPISNNTSINTNNYAVNNNGQGNGQAANNDTNTQSKPQTENTNTQVSGSDTLDYLNAQAASMKPVEKPRVLNISKYVTPEQAQRIIASMLDVFEPKVEEYLSAINSEVGSVLSDDAKLELAAQMFELKNM